MTGDDVDDAIRAAIDGEMALLDPAVRVARERAEPLLDDDFLEFGASGAVWDKESILAALAGPMSAEDDGITATDVRGVRLADDVVHVTYTATWHGGTSRRSSVWRRTGGRWRMYFHQGTPVPGA